MADTIRIPATTRSDFGKGYARRIRNNDQIPAVVYGHGAEPQHVVLDAIESPVEGGAWPQAPFRRSRCSIHGHLPLSRTGR